MVVGRNHTKYLLEKKIGEEEWKRGRRIIFKNNNNNNK